MKRTGTGAFSAECRQVLRNPWLYVSMAVALVVLISDSFDPLWRTITGVYPRMYDSPERYSVTLLFGMMVLIAPVLSVFPYAAAYTNDVTSGMLRIRLMRCGRLGEYTWARYRATFVSGALALSVPVAMYSALLVAICGGYVYNPQNTSVIEQGIFAPLLIWGGSPFFAVQVLLVGVFGGLWACVGLAVSAWIVNRYVAVVAPFVIYFTMIYIFQLIEWRVLDPGELLYLLPQHQTNPAAGICVMTIVPACELVLAYMAFRRGVLRRLKYGRI